MEYQNYKCPNSATGFTARSLDRYCKIFADNINGKPTALLYIIIMQKQTVMHKSIIMYKVLRVNVFLVDDAESLSLTKLG